MRMPSDGVSPSPTHYCLRPVVHSCGCYYAGQLCRWRLLCRARGHTLLHMCRSCISRLLQSVVAETQPFTSSRDSCCWWFDRCWFSPPFVDGDVMTVMSLTGHPLPVLTGVVVTVTMVTIRTSLLGMCCSMRSPNRCVVLPMYL